MHWKTVTKALITDVVLTKGTPFNLLSITKMMRQGWMLGGNSNSGITLTMGNNVLPLKTPKGIVYAMKIRRSKRTVPSTNPFAVVWTDDEDDYDIVEKDDIEKDDDEVRDEDTSDDRENDTSDDNDDQEVDNDDDKYNVDADKEVDDDDADGVNEDNDDEDIGVDNKGADSIIEYDEIEHNNDSDEKMVEDDVTAITIESDNIPSGFTRGGTKFRGVATVKAKKESFGIGCNNTVTVESSSQSPC
jgi:hypothetical protein